MTDLPSSFDILAYFEGETTLPVRASKYERHGACPWCGGSDRFLVSARYNRWRCRQECGGSGCHGDHWEDLITYVRRRYNATYEQACAQLGSLPSSPPRPKEDPQLDARLADELRRVAEECADRLWARPAYVAALGTWRHLTPATIREFGLGYSDGTSSYRLSGELVTQVPCGITIPLVGLGQVLHGLKVRRPRTQPTGPKYLAAPGSKPNLFGRLTGKPVLLVCEGEFDAMVLWQELGGEVDVLTAGAAGAAFRPAWTWPLLAYAATVIIHDNDAAGAKSQTWAPLGARAVHLAVPHGKDITELVAGGHNLRAWLAPHLDNSAPVADEEELTPWYSGPHARREEAVPVQHPALSLMGPCPRDERFVDENWVRIGWELRWPSLSKAALAALASRLQGAQQHIAALGGQENLL